MSDIPAPIPDKKPYERLLVFMRRVVWYVQPFLVCALFVMLLRTWDFAVRLPILRLLPNEYPIQKIIGILLYISFVFLFALLTRQKINVQNALIIHHKNDVPAICLFGFLVAYFMSGVELLILFLGRFAQCSYWMAWLRGIFTLPLLIKGILSVPAAAWEEVFWRGIFLKLLLERMRLPFALIFSAISFGLWHILAEPRDFQSLLNLILHGFLYGSVFFATKRLWPAIMCHATMNFLNTSITESITPFGEVEVTWLQFIEARILLPLFISIALVTYYKKTKAFYA